MSAAGYLRPYKTMDDVFRIFLGGLCVWCVWINVFVNAVDRPCTPRDVGGESIVCVCNETYYDTITRQPAPMGEYCYYTSSKSGLRFCRSSGVFGSPNKQNGCTKIELFPEEAFQTIDGFGGAVTDAAGLNWRNLPKSVQTAMIETYFGPTGLEYNIIRTPIGGSDFSTHVYTYNDYPVGDKCLRNFSLAYEDYLFKIPMIQQAMQASCGTVQVLASCWSPPVWMKTNNNITGRGFLLPEYYQAYADYHIKYIEAYEEECIPIWALTTTNEPYNGMGDSIPFNSLGWTPKTQGTWIAKNLGPTIRNSKYCDVKIVCCDDQRFNLPVYYNKLIEVCPDARQYIDGVGVHWYGNLITPASLYSYVLRCSPDKFLIATEACEGWRTNDVSLGNWTRAENYCSDIITDLNYDLTGWIDWNLCLDEVGGPNWVGNTVDSPVIVMKDQKEFVKQPMFYAMGHFSKWIPRGSSRINVEVTPCNAKLEQVAFRTPEQNIVVVMQNLDCNCQSVRIKIGKREAVIKLEGNSITTVEFPFANRYFGVRAGCVRSNAERSGCKSCRSY